VPTDPALLEDALARTAETHGPGLVGLVTDHGEPVFEGAIGLTDLADGRRPTADDWFRIGSVTKTYVSAVLVQLLREGAFARTDTVEQWLPGLVPGGDQLPVELLLRMRSGLPDYAWAMHTTVVLRTAADRTVVLCQNGIDLHDVLTSDTPFVAAALAGG
jgi:CubicO group peptidase (beta-lactamase class C family)